MLSTIDSLTASFGSLAGQRVIVRCDLNVPLDGDVITDDGRIRASLRTVNELIHARARVVVISHLGRPKGAPDAQYSLAPVAQRLSELLGKPVVFASDTVGTAASTAVAELGDGDIALLENLRFNSGEGAASHEERVEFANKLAQLGDLFVSDGFGVVHRDQASVVELAEILPHAAGRLIETELGVLEQLTENPQRPYTVVLGGSKVSDKLGVIEHLLPRVDTLLIGGGMMFTFLAAQGHSVGASLLESNQLDTVRGYLDQAKALGVQIVLPVDTVVASAFAADADHEVKASHSMEETPWGAAGLGLDIGPETSQQFAEIIGQSSTVFWNGPMGVFEFPAFAEGTRAVATALTRVDGLSVVGGGDSAAAIRVLGFSDSDFGHISTGGGASLEFLEGKRLPGLEVLGWE